MRATKAKHYTRLAVIGTPITAFLAARGALKCKERFEEYLPETTGEKAKIVAKSFAPAVIAGACTIACILKLDHICELSAIELKYLSETFTKYKKQVVKEVGEEKAKEIEAAIARENWGVSAEGYYLPKSADNKNRLFLDTTGDYGYFYATADRVKDAMYHLNRNFQLRGWCLLSEFYEFIGIPKTDYSDTHGWEYSQMLEWGLTPWIDFDTITDPEHDFTTIVYMYEPTHIYTWED